MVTTYDFYHKGVFSIKSNVNDLKLKRFATVIFIIYILSVLYVTLLAWNYGASLGAAGPGGRNYNLIPFRSIYRISVFSKDIMDPIRILIGNIVLFVPFGLLLPLASKKLSQSIVKVSLLAMVFSITIEASQFLFTYRVSNIDDVILNTVGAWIGAFFLVKVMKKRVSVSIK
ncbi:VanZ family protein [Bacillus alkalicellulosilyticus]|uniref:VanZ family protein n=1 Tax=Alkalihalobacterium alkalicellulosilyticum TaxID=1912214 RepID=UPI000997C085|nr:VanZ family protein [Bacillus alkalicellulosilyticus]